MNSNLSVTPLVYHNVMLYLLAETDAERNMIHFYETKIRSGVTPLRLESVSNWCDAHHIRLESQYVWLKSYPLTANLWNLYTYLYWKIRRQLHIR